MVAQVLDQVQENLAPHNLVSVHVSYVLEHGATRRTGLLGVGCDSKRPELSAFRRLSDRVKARDVGVRLSVGFQKLGHVIVVVVFVGLYRSQRLAEDIPTQEKNKYDTNTVLHLHPLATLYLLFIYTLGNNRHS